MKNAINYGVSFGVATCIWIFVEHLLGFHSTRIQLGEYSNWAAFALPVLFIVLACRTELARAPNASLGRLVALALGVTLFGDVLSLPFSWAYHHYINPQWLDTLLAFEREKMILAGRSAPEIDRRLMALQIGNSTTVQVIGGVLSSLFFGPIIGLPTAAVLRSRARRAPTAPRMIRPAA